MLIKVWHIQHTSLESNYPGSESCSLSRSSVSNSYNVESYTFTHQIQQCQLLFALTPMEVCSKTNGHVQWWICRFATMQHLHPLSKWVAIKNCGLFYNISKCATILKEGLTCFKHNQTLNKSGKNAKPWNPSTKPVCIVIRPLSCLRDVVMVLFCYKQFN